MRTTIFDIETGPLAPEQLAAIRPPFGAFEEPPPFCESMVKYGNTKDVDKRREKLEAARLEYNTKAVGARQKYIDDLAKHEAEFAERAALNATTGQVLAIGYLTLEPGSGQQPEWELGGGSEPEILNDFWDRFKTAEVTDSHMVGFFIHGFDLPFLIRRSWIIGVSVPNAVRQSGRYWHRLFIDLHDLWQLGNRGEKIDLDTLARAFGLGCKNGNGADFHKLWATDRTKAVEYLKADIKLTAHAAKKIGVL